MSATLGVIAGLVAMLAWGAADFFAAKASRATGVFKTYFWSQVISLIIFFFLFLYSPALPPDQSTIGLIALTGFLMLIAYWAFYKGLEKGKVAVVTAVSATWALVTVFFGLTVLGEVVNKFQAFGVLFAVAGVFLTAFKLKDMKEIKLQKGEIGINYALAALFGWGLAFTAINVILNDFSWIPAIFFVKLATVAFSLLYAIPTNTSVAFPKKVPKLAILALVAAGILETIAYLAFGFGLTIEFSVVVAPIAATYPIAATILARIFFREKLYLNQKIGLLSIIIGVVLLAL